MHLLHISTALSWRGGEQQLAYLLEGLEQKKLMQTVLCFSGSQMEKFCANRNIQTITFKRASAFQPILLYRVAKQIKLLRIDLIHAHDSHAHTMAVLSAVLFGHRAKIILSRKVDFPIRNNFFSAFKYNHPSIKKIICVSMKIEEVLSAAIKNKSVLCIIYDGIDLSRFEPIASGNLRRDFSIDGDVLIIGNVAAIAAHKDYPTFVEVAKIVLSKGIKAKFLIIGDGPDKNKIEKCIAQAGLKNEVLITGFRSDISHILPELDIFLFTSKTEGLGSSILDAYACGVPIVATNAGGIPEIVQHEKTGLLAPVQNAELLAANVLRLISDTALKDRLVQSGKAWVKNFSKEKNAELTYEVYREVID